MDNSSRISSSVDVSFTLDINFLWLALQANLSASVTLGIDELGHCRLRAGCHGEVGVYHDTCFFGGGMQHFFS